LSDKIGVESQINLHLTGKILPTFQLRLAFRIRPLVFLRTNLKQLQLYCFTRQIYMKPSVKVKENFSFQFYSLSESGSTHYKTSESFLENCGIQIFTLRK